MRPLWPRLATPPSPRGSWGRRGLGQAPYWPAIAALKRGRVVAAYSSQRDEADLLGQALAAPRFLSLREDAPQKLKLGALLILERACPATGLFSWLRSVDSAFVASVP